MTNLSDRLLAYFRSWYSTSTAAKRKKGVEVQLTFEQFVSLFQPRHLQSLQEAIDANRLRYFQNQDNRFALVLTWTSYTACQSNVFSKDTAIICSRQKSKAINRIQAGEKLSERTKGRMSAARKGTSRSAEAKQAISEGAKGRKKAPWSEQRRADRCAQIAARKAGAK